MNVLAFPPIWYLILTACSPLILFLKYHSPLLFSVLNNSIPIKRDFDCNCHRQAAWTLERSRQIHNKHAKSSHYKKNWLQSNKESFGIEKTPFCGHKGFFFFLNFFPKKTSFRHSLEECVPWESYKFRPASYFSTIRATNWRPLTVVYAFTSPAFALFLLLSSPQNSLRRGQPVQVVPQ